MIHQFRGRLLSVIPVFLLQITWAFSQTIPAITSFSPLVATPGNTVTIIGKGFNTTPAQNIVMFGVARAVVVQSAADQLTVTVPVGATYGPLRVINLANGLTAFSTKFFIPSFPGMSGNLKYQTAVRFPVLRPARTIAIGDMDVDGKTDMAVGLEGDSISLLRNRSVTGMIDTSSFAPMFNLNGNKSDNLSTSIGDLDGDGKPELIISRQDSGFVSVYRNISTKGTINASSFAPRVNFPGGPGQIWKHLITDFDQDGKADLLVLKGAWFSIFRNTSTVGSITQNSFAPRVDILHNNNSWGGFVTGDMDGDGKPDVALSNQWCNCISVFRNRSTPGKIDTSSAGPMVEFSATWGPGEMALGDLDGDGKPELIISNSDSNKVSILQNISSPGSITQNSFAPRVDFITGNRPRSIAIGDLDGDGKPDLAVANLRAKTVSVLFNTTTKGPMNSSSFSSKWDLATENGPEFLTIGDFDGDGRPDIVTTELTGYNHLPNVYVYRHNTQVTSVRDVDAPVGVDIAPNPGSRFLNISIKDGKPWTDLVMHDMTGRELMRMDIRRRSLSPITIDMSDKPRGTYIISLMQGNRIKTLRWVKN